MKLFIAFLFATTAVCANAQQLWSPLEVDISRSLVKDLFESNAVPYIQPMVRAINATSNSRFYNTALVPAHVEKPYFRVSLNGMLGFVPEEMKWYTPTLNFGPRINVSQTMLQYGTPTFENGKFIYKINPTYEDTLGLSTALIKELMRDALDSGYFKIPPTGATLFGYVPDSKVGLPTNQQLITILHQRTEYKLLDSSAKAALDTLIGTMSLPPNMTLPPGADMSTLIAAVPQLEIGSLWGTEALIRFVPPVEFDDNIGKFSFWGFGLKHSISQYFPERWFDAAIQAVYQGTSLANTVGYTQSKLEAEATIWSGNIHVSKEFDDWLNIYTGFNYEQINVQSTYTYVLPQEIQLALGLLPNPPNPGDPATPTPEQPGDTKPQSSIVNVQDTNMKWTIGASAHVGNFWIAADYSLSNFDILSFGVAYTF